MQKKKFDEVKRLAEDGDTWRKMTYTNLLTQKMAHDDDDDRQTATTHVYTMKQRTS